MQLLERNYAENMSIQTWKGLQLGLSVSNLAKYDLRIVGSRIERVTSPLGSWWAGSCPSGARGEGRGHKGRNLGVGFPKCTPTTRELARH